VASLPVRSEGLEVNEVVDGLVVYIAERERVHYLNASAALVFDMCSGRNSETSIIRALQEAYRLSEPPATEVGECLERLRDEGLIS
jgi:Coenzyme PQQ synthesis protein D (PqqD)